MAGRKDLFDESMRQGDSAAWNLNWEEAIGHYRRAVEEFPESAEALACLGLGLLETGKPKDALAAYHRASRADPGDPIPLEKCSEILEDLGQITDAIAQRDAAAVLHMQRKDVEKALLNWTHIARLAPNNLDARSRLAMTYERIGRQKEAIQEYLAVAAILQRAGNPDRAIEVTQRILAMVPGDADGIRAFRMLRQGQPLPDPAKPIMASDPVAPKEKKAFLKAEKEQLQQEPQGPGDPEEEALQHALAKLADIVLETPGGKGAGGGDRKERAKESRRGTGKISRQSQPEAARHLSAGIDYLSRGHKRAAVKEFQQAMEAGAKSTSVSYIMGQLLKDIGDVDGAWDYLTISLDNPDLAMGTNLALGRLARTRNNMDEAAHYLLEALRLADVLSIDSDESEQLNQVYERIKASQAGGDRKRVVRIVESALRFLSGPDWKQRIQNTRKQLEGQGEGEEVVPIAEMLVVGGSDRAMQALQRIDQMVERNQYTSAMEEAMLALSHSPGYLPLHTRMAELMIHGGRVDEGVSKMITIGETYAARGEHQRSAEVMATVLQHAPVNMGIRKRMITHLLSSGRAEEALDHYMEMAELHRQMAQIDEARQVLAEALDLAKSVKAGSQRITEILHQMGDIDLARLDLRKGVEIYDEIRMLDPDDTIAWENLIDLHLRLGQEAKAANGLDNYLDVLVSGGEGVKALAILEQMVRDHPGKQAFHARLAEAYRAAGRKSEAIAQFDVLGELQLDAGQIKEAIQTIKLIVSLDPPDLEGYRELLRNLEAGG